jgi:hypothetical protein
LVQWRKPNNHTLYLVALGKHRARFHFNKGILPMTLKQKLKSSTAPVAAEPPTRTPARSELDRGIKAANVAHETVAAAQTFLDKAADRVEHAQALARDAQAKLQELDAAGVERVSKTWPPVPPSQEEREQRRDAETALAEAVRTLGAVEANRNRARDAYEAEVVKLAPLAKDIDRAVTGVLVEEAEAALAHLVKARRIAIDAEAVLRSLAGAMVARQNFVEAEKIARTLYELPRPEGETNPAPYLDLALRLRSDPDAVVMP